MKQAKFIYNTRSICSGNIIDMGNGVISVSMRSDIFLEHNYKNNDQITVRFSDTKEVYVLDNDIQLEEIYRIYLSKINISEPLHRYCEENLTKVTKEE